MDVVEVPPSFCPSDPPPAMIRWPRSLRTGVRGVSRNPVHSRRHSPSKGPDTFRRDLLLQSGPWIIALLSVTSTWGPGLAHATTAFATDHLLNPSPGVQGPLALPEVYGYLCLAEPSATPPSPLGCGGYLPIPATPVYLTPWKDLSPSTPVAWTDHPLSIPWERSTVSTSDGSFALNTSGDIGSYVLWAPNATDRIGGAFAILSLTNSTVYSSLVAYPYMPQGNQSFVLPAYNSLVPYVFNANCVGCGAFHWGNGGAQVPNLAWTQDGAFYVNASDRLVFYSFVNHTVRNIAPWWPLFDNVMEYAGVENTEWLTTDGSWVYEFGCASSCSSGSDISFYAVNVTTGRTFSWNFSGVNDQALRVNAQINMIGLHGNDSTAALILANGTVIGWDLWTRHQWTLGKLSYFEANNVEWVPPLDSFIDVRAEGDTQDTVSQWELSDRTGTLQLTEASSLSYWTGNTAVNGENWGAYNVTDHELVFMSAFNFTVFGTFVFGTQWNPANGTYELSGLLRSYDSAAYAAPFGESVEASEHRAVILASGDLNTAEGIDTFFNNTQHLDPFSGTYQDTNVTVGYDGWQPQPPAGYWYTTLSNVFPEGLFYNASYGLTGYGVDCRSPVPCTMLGGIAGPPGTVEWTWPVGSPRFPFPARAPLAQPMAPGTVQNVSYHQANDTFQLNWTPPATGANPILNYTVAWRVGTSSVHWSNLFAQNLTTTLSGLPASGTLNVSIWASNLHGTGRALSLSVAYPQLESYPVVFQEKGLPAGSPWTVSILGQAHPVNATQEVLSLGNGTYPFLITGPANFTVSPSNGTLTVNGSPQTLSATFNPILPSRYTADFKESGLPNGTAWGLSLDGTSFSVTGPSLVVPLPNGTFPYTISSPRGYLASPSSGNVVVSGAPTEVNISFANGTPTLYPVTFSEVGLPGGTSWSVDLQGVTKTANTSTISFWNPDGNYTYSVNPVPGFWSNVSGGTVRVNGSAPTLPALAFQPIPKITSLRLFPPSLTLSPGSNATISTNIACSPSPCPTNISYTWVLGSGIGRLNSTTSSTVTFIAGASPGVGNIAVAASLWGHATTAITNITVVANATVVSALALAPVQGTVETGGSLLLSATAHCSPSPCPSGLPIQWTVNNTVGVVRGAGLAVVFVAGSIPGKTEITARTTLGGQSQVARTEISVEGIPRPGAISVMISPNEANITGGASLVLRAEVACVRAPCSGPTLIHWSLNDPLGTLNQTTGATVSFSAGSVGGIVTVVAGAREGNLSAANQSELEIWVPAVHPSGLGPSFPQGFLGLPQAVGNATLLVMGAAAIVAMTYLFHRRDVALRSRPGR